MKINSKALCEAFQYAAAEETVPAESVSGYLLEQVLRPTLRGNPPRLRDIDYDAFDEEDIDELIPFYEEMQIVSEELQKFLTAVASVAPVPCHSRHFC